MNNRNKAILYMLLASFSMTTMSTLVKFTRGAVPLMQQIFYRFLVLTLVLLVILRKQGVPLAVKRDRWRDLFFRCLFGFMGMISVFYANRNLLLADAVILQKLSPIFITLFATLILKEKLTKGKLGSLALGFLGAMVVIRPSGDYKLLPFLAALNAAICTGVSMTFLRKLHTMNSLKVIFYFSLTCLLGTAPATLTNLTMFPANIWMLLGGIALAGGLGQFFMTRAYHNAPASEISIYDYFGVVISPVFGYFVFQEVIGKRTAIGMALILLSGYISFSYNRKQARKEQ